MVESRVNLVERRVNVSGQFSGWGEISVRYPRGVPIDLYLSAKICA